MLDMINFSWLKKYSCIDDDFANNMQKYKHKFTPLNYEEIVAQEERMGRRFPEELREFYIQIGYGAFGINTRLCLDLVLPPENVVDSIMEEGMFEDNDIIDDIDLKSKMIFFDAGDNTYLCLDLSKEDCEGRCPVVYATVNKCVCLAKSLEDFAKKMDEKSSYYTYLW